MATGASNATVFRARDAKLASANNQLIASEDIMNAPIHPLITLENVHAAANYDPLPVVLAKGEGVWLWDDMGNRYLDMMSAYSAVSFGHSNPVILRALVEQVSTLAVTSRAF